MDNNMNQYSAFHNGTPKRVQGFSVQHMNAPSGFILATKKEAATAAAQDRDMKHTVPWVGHPLYRPRT